MRDVPGHEATRETAMARSWWPMMFALLIFYHPVELLDVEHPSLAQWIFTVLGMLAFLLLFATVLVFWHKRRPFLWVIGLLTALWLGYSSCHLPSHVFLDFAVLLIPWAVRGNLRRTVGLMMLLLAVAGVFVYLTSPGPERPLFIDLIVGGVLTLSLLAASQVLVVRAVLGLHNLSRAAERERIARRVSQLLSQALAEITSKSSRAHALLREADLAVRGDEARHEIATVEAVSRQALSEIRRTLREYRAEARETARE